MNTIIAFIVIFGALVFFHELGHLLLAKKAGMLCREFAIGFGPKIFSFYKNETLYTIRLLPLGGFVRVAGEDPEMIEIKPGHNIGLLIGPNGKVAKIIINNKSKYQNLKVIEVEHADLVHKLVIRGYEAEDESLQEFEVDEKAFLVMDEKETQIAPYNRQFGSKTLGQRMAQIFAGPLMNFILAFVIFMILAFIQGSPINKSMLGELTEDGAAIEAGLHQGDKVIAIEGQSVETWDEFVAIIQKSPEQPLAFTVIRNDKELEVTVTPKKREVAGEEQGYIGVYPPFEKSFMSSIKYGGYQTYYWTKEILIGVGKLITGQFSFDMLSGPVGIYKYTDEVAQSGVINLMHWGALLSINLGIFNLLPLPALDGGRLLFLGLEAVRGKPIDPQKEGMVHFIGFAFLMLLMLVVTWNDIQNFFL